MKRILILVLLITYFGVGISYESGFVSFINASTSAEIGTSEATTILKSVNWMSYFMPAVPVTWEYRIKGNIYDTFITLSNFTFSNSNFNITNNSLSNMTESGLKVSGDANSMKVVITFSYNARTGLATFPTGTGVLIVTD